MALLRISTPRPLFYCSGCGQNRARMLRDNDSLGDPVDMAKAHNRSTGHRPVLIGGHGYIRIVNPHLVRCLMCFDSAYLALERGVQVCPCVELIAGGPGAPAVWRRR